MTNPIFLVYRYWLLAGLLLWLPIEVHAQSIPNRAPTPAEAYKLSIEVDTARGWRRGGAGTLNFSQVSLSNWAPGGQSSLSLLALGNVYVHFRGESHTFDMASNLVYGLIKAGKSKLRKNDDRLEVNARYARSFSSNWSYASQLNLKTQLTPTNDVIKTDSLLSKFFAPAYVLASLGVEYRQNEDFSLFFSPITGKFTIVNDQTLADAGAFGVKAARRDEDDLLVVGSGERMREELGAYFNARYRHPLMTNITYQTRLELFSNYFHDPQNIDVNWESLLDFKVNKFFSASVAATLIYDDDILVPLNADKQNAELTARGRRIQFKETLGIGLTYKF
ncbi:DUF3078 domain-containing protein [Hymenobacter tibetensis]|uniref:DUF3078 domain-containing protein n=1 Tax=Hymenobacter tibetensis TaxID=497967 RepID=A0ABY4CW86_9BACT|nr:DUF3078 domain-containing protein [Hymenobacter tibetensis]UOG74443.1 DUF3078 domain-containing protein [Hymenobacter tibetensis]